MARAVLLAAAETAGRREIPRTPERTAEMADPRQVDAFDAEGAPTGGLGGQNLFNVRAIAALAREGGHVVDFGCGSGRLLAQLATCRPDLRITGIDLSEPMIEAGRKLISERGLADRVSLRRADMTRPPQFTAVDLVTSVVSLHHLPTADMLARCLESISDIRRRAGAGVWIFDFARPRRPGTADAFPRIITPDARPELRSDATHSLRAAWSWTELRDAVGTALGTGVMSARGRPLPLFQIHWSPRGLWREPHVPDRSDRQARQLAMLFAGTLPDGAGSGRGPT